MRHVSVDPQEKYLIDGPCLLYTLSCYLCNDAVSTSHYIAIVCHLCATLSYKYPIISIIPSRVNK
jgi:hypothetical protein